MQQHAHVKLWNFFQIYNSDPMNQNAYIKNWSAQKSYKESLEHALLAYEFQFSTKQCMMHIEHSLVYVTPQNRHLADDSASATIRMMSLWKRPPDIMRTSKHTHYAGGFE
jgi:hypothetical protein